MNNLPHARSGELTFDYACQSVIERTTMRCTVAYGATRYHEASTMLYNSLRVEDISKQSEHGHVDGGDFHGGQVVHEFVERPLPLTITKYDSQKTTQRRETRKTSRRNDDTKEGVSKQRYIKATLSRKFLCFYVAVRRLLPAVRIHGKAWLVAKQTKLGQTEDKHLKRSAHSVEISGICLPNLATACKQAN